MGVDVKVHRDITLDIFSPKTHLSKQNTKHNH